MTVVCLVNNLSGTPCWRQGGITLQVAPILKIWRSDSDHYLGRIPVNVTGFLLRGNSAAFHLEGYQKLGYHLPGSYFLSWDSVIAAFCWWTPSTFRFGSYIEWGRKSASEGHNCLFNTAVMFGVAKNFYIVIFFIDCVKNLSPEVFKASRRQKNVSQGMSTESWDYTYSQKTCNSTAAVTLLRRICLVAEVQHSDSRTEGAHGC